MPPRQAYAYSHKYYRQLLANQPLMVDAYHQIMMKCSLDKLMLFLVGSLVLLVLIKNNLTKEKSNFLSQAPINQYQNKSHIIFYF